MGLLGSELLLHFSLRTQCIYMESLKMLHGDTNDLNNLLPITMTSSRYLICQRYSVDGSRCSTGLTGLVKAISGNHQASQYQNTFYARVFNSVKLHWLCLRYKTLNITSNHRVSKWSRWKIPFLHSFALPPVLAHYGARRFTIKSCGIKSGME